jgi:TonB-dependent receptor
MQTKFIQTLLFLFFSLSIFAQTGSITGNIKDSKLKEAIIGATVLITGTELGAATDFEGNFTINKVPAGNYTIKITYVSYQNNFISNVRVEAGKATTISTELSEDLKTLDAVVIKGQRNKSTEVAVVSEIKQMRPIAVGISAQQIQRSQDRDASAVVRRLPGVSIQNDRFVIVRGLNERYNSVMLNNALTPSTEVDAKSFSFDLIPSAAIDRILIFKSASADLPGEFGGGVIQIFTKTIPDANSLTFGFSSSYRPNTTFEAVQSYKGSSTDILGFDNGTRALPTGFPSTSRIQNEGRPSEATMAKFKAMSPYFDLQKVNVKPDLRANLGYSHRFFLGNKELTTFNNINYSLSHQNTTTNQSRFGFYDTATNFDLKELTDEQYKDQSYTENVRLGVLSNWALILNPNNKIEFRNLFNQLSSKETVFRDGINFEESGRQQNNYAFRYESRSIYSGQLNGTHELSETSKLTWLASMGYTFRNEPDFRRFRSSRANANEPFQIDIAPTSTGATLQQAARFYSRLNEVVYGGGLNWEKKVGTKKSEDSEQISLKTGLFAETKQRLFKARWLGLVNPNRLGSDVLTASPEQFFSPDLIASDKLFYAEGTNTDDKYFAQNLLTAAYVNLFVPFTDKLNATVGFRGEFNRQQLQSQERGGGAKIRVDNPVFSPLPSLNVSYNLSERNQVKLAYSSTVNRPEFRELANFSYYDFNFNVSRTGNPNIKTATIHNFDARYEFSPSKSETISLSVFYKQFLNPIEAKIRYAGSGINFSVENAEKAYSTGLELDIRKNLNGIFNSTFINNLTLLLNASIISSNVVTGFAAQENRRALQGQSPYLVNAGLFYSNDATGFQANVLYNVVGKRIFAVGDNQLSPTIYELPRNVVDLNITKILGEHFELKASVQDLFNQPFKLVQDLNRDGQTNTNDGTYQEFRKGSVFTVGITYKK